MTAVATEKSEHCARILIVDDEEGIRHSLRDILEDEGYQVLLAESGAEALNMVSIARPDLVLLDIWMPGMDGMETLSSLKAVFPALAVVMMSGHASISTAVEATKYGAADFVEKPLDLENTLSVIERALEALPEVQEDEISKLEEIVSEKKNQIPELKRTVFEEPYWKGDPVAQKTLANSTLIYGQGLHSGKKSGLILQPLPIDSGIHFMGVDNAPAVPAHIAYVQSTGFATTLRLGKTEVSTIEHLMSALAAYGITNLLVKCNGEVPVLDGSSQEFCRLIEEAGVEEQSEPLYAIKLREKIELKGKGNESLTLEPADEFVIDYTLDYPEPLGKQHLVFTLSDVEAYKREIAPARTFGFVKDVGQLQKMGLAQGGRFDNFVLYGDDGAINDKLRFENEAVRHKILDAIGDLALLGRPLQAKVTAVMTGHSDNVNILKLLREKMAE